ncbi:ANK2 [Symbiodinium sp. CCMP2456]|nr:ANK2 [Symbiodinium sp. CCMP2456]
MFKLFLASLALVLFQGDAQLRGARRLQDTDPAPEAPAEAPAEAPEAPAETPAAPAPGGLTAEEQAKLNRDFVTAIRRQDTATAETLLASGAQIDDISMSGPHWSPLAQACVSVDSTMALWLLEHGADPDVADNRGRTPLYHAVHYYMYDVVEEMLKTAKNLSPHDGDGVDMLTRAVWQKDARMVEMLLDAGATSASATTSAENAGWEIAKLFGYTSTVAPLVVTEAPAETPILP